ncbi:hypothetical protein QHI69_00710 [Burkholderia gladioli pv. gladioli]|uniref:hypothetical protein n=1 Tax=Burkholderia gladioli TaxID=28095 RepID=UPI0011B280B3|nr:hypothetical protein [Burkholderia gladioli]MDJ1160425.1 hypothetical protein [Burkholderia gladioli pv. gladioli]
MAKLSDNPIEANDISEYLNTRDDFALELRSLQKAHDAGFSASHGGSYDDPVTGKSRQYDLRASLAKSNDSIGLAIECKSLQKNFPLVISRIPRTRNESFLERLDGRPNYLPEALHLHRVRETSLYPVGEGVGKSTVQIGKLHAQGSGWSANDAETYDKWNQAIASAYDMSRLIAKQLSGQVNTYFKNAIIPVLVVSNETLWVVDYDATGGVSVGPQRVHETQLYVGRRNKLNGRDFAISHLHICTEEGLIQLLSRISSDDAWWKAVFVH